MKTSPPMRLSFDHGTLLVRSTHDLDGRTIPGLLWDPRVRLWRAPAWRYHQVLNALRERGWQVTDDVAPRGVGSTVDWRPVELRPYQQAAALSWELAGHRGIVALPTGSGKTRVAIGALAGHRGRGLCLVPTRALLRQWHAALSQVCEGPVGCLGDGERRVETVTVATFESAYRSMPQIGRNFQLLVVDEVHHFGIGARDEALEMSIAERRLGLTATPPEGAALERLRELVGPIVYRMGIGNLAGTWLSDFDLVTLQLALTRDERSQYERDRRLFTDVNRRFRRLHPLGSWQEFVSAASQSAEGRAGLLAWRRSQSLLGFTHAKADAVAMLLARHRGNRVLLFTADNDTAYTIARKHLVMPMTCDIARTERNRALDAFRRGELGALVSSRVLNEGIDVPDADVAILVGGTRGQREYVQRIGRLLRPAPGKRAIVYELVTMGTTEVQWAVERRRALDTSKPVIG